MLVATRHGDLAEYQRIIGRGEVFLRIPKTVGDALVDGTRTKYLLPLRTEAGRQVLDVCTVGELADLSDEWCMMSLLWEAIARDDSRRRRVFVVNRGTPIEAAFDRRMIKTWLAEPGRPAGRSPLNSLITTRRGPTRGPLAHGLGCGAHLAVLNGVVWNSTINSYWGHYVSNLQHLRSGWGIDGPVAWSEQLGHLFKVLNTEPVIEFVLAMRRRLAGPAAATLPAQVWCRELVSWAQAEALHGEEIEHALRMIGRIMDYEAAFRIEGLLAADQVVHTVAAYDYGRFVNLVRWGLEARYCDRATAEPLIARAGALSQAVYGSWQDFSVAYTLGRALRFDEGEFGPCYQQMLDAHRVLADDPASPWRTIPWYSHDRSSRPGMD